MRTTKSGVADDGTSEYSRDGAELLAQVAVPLSVGKVAVQPSVGLGLSWMQSKSVLGDPCAFFAGVDPTCFTQYKTGSTQLASSWSPLAEAGIAVSVPLSNHLNLQLGGALGMRWFGTGATKIDYTGGNPTVPPADCTEPNTSGCNNGNNGGNGTTDPPPPGDPSNTGGTPPTDLTQTMVLSPAQPSTMTRLFIGLEFRL